MTDEITKLLEETRRLCAEATPGPWEIGEMEYVRSMDTENEWLPVADSMGNMDNAALIAHARTALERLRDEVERLLAERALFGPIEIAREGLRENGEDPDEIGRQGAEFVTGLQEQRRRQLPRVWVGASTDCDDGFWMWEENGEVFGEESREGPHWRGPFFELTPGSMFVPGNIPKPTIDPRTIKLIATCSEVDWT